MSKKTIVVHDGEFHADDVFAAASLCLLLEKEGVDFEIIRTRDESIIGKADYVADVGRIYDPEKNRFDHHQEGGAGERDNGVPYAAFGLVWKTYGATIAGSEEIAKRIDQKIAMPIDGPDNGVSIAVSSFDNVRPYNFSDFLYTFLPTWKEDASVDVIFGDAVHIAKQLLKREIEIQQHNIEGEKFVLEAYEGAEDKRLIILDDRYPWSYALSQLPEPLYAVYPKDGKWRIKTVRDLGTFKNRKDLPKAWAGKSGTELQEITGVSDAIYCHNKLFIASAESREGALALAKIALDH